MNKTRYKIATLTGSAVMAAMLLSLLILNIVFNKKIELRAENAIKNVFTLNSDEYLNYESEMIQALYIMLHLYIWGQIQKTGMTYIRF